jgi:hypothetical protein
MAEVYCGSEPCPLFLNSTCVFYTGESLLYIGVQNNDTLEAIIVKINQAFQNAGVGYAFTNGLIQPTPFQPVQLGGALIQNTTIGGNFTLAFTGNVQAARHITTGGSSSQFVKGDGTLDSTAYQPAANYITGLSGDATASGPGVAAMTLATVNFASGTFGNGNTIPIVTVNAKGLVTNITPVPVTIPPLPLTFIGDVVGSGFTGSNISMLLQNVNANPYNTITPLKFTVNGKGLVTSASPITASDIVNILGYYPGTSGTSGSDGTSGTSGTTGTSGSSGTSATSGTSGTTGTSGTSATSGTSGTSGTDGTGGTSGTSGSTGTSGTAGTSGTSATSGTSGTTGSSGTSGTSGSTGTSGSSGTTGTSGSSGTTGTSGSSGTSGTTGTSGSSGTTGTSGTDGTGGTSGSSGTTGSSGSSGTSGTSATSGSSGTSGSTGTSGSSGLSGDRFKTTSTTTYTLQAPGGTGTITVGLGLAYSVAQSIIIAYDANNHNEAEVTSYDPLTGSLSFIVFRLTGSGTYSVWSVNVDGASGGDGSSGSSGTSGTSATDGTSGTTGTSGSSGTSGTTGTSGSSGSSGTSAIDGTNGTSGTSGTTGTSGSSGTSGTTGTSGSSGTSGTSATNGTGGTSGTSGSSGTSGTTGTSGTSATSGTSGTSATSGTTGTSGTSGTNGTGGTSGTSGSSATSGTSGTSGVNGAPGASGTSGTSGTSVAVSGTTNTMAKFTSATTIGNSALTDNGSTLAYSGSSILLNNSVNIQTFNTRNLIVKATGAGDAGILGRGSSDQFAFQVYGSGGDYGFLNGAWNNWDIRKTANGSLFLNDQSTWYISTSEVYMNRVYGITDMRSPIYYDQNDTGYFGDFNGISSLWGIAIRGDNGPTSTTNQIFFWGGGNTTTSAIGFKNNGGSFPNPTGSGDGYNTYLTMDTPGRGWVFREGVGGTNFNAAYTSGWILNNGLWQANASMRAPIFYDSNNTAYYVDPNASGFSSILNGTIRLDSGAFGTNSRSSSSTGPISRTFAPQGAANSFQGGNVTGSIKIRLPFRANDCMWSMKVRIYEYTNNATSEYTIGNYSYSAGAYHRGAYYIGGTGSSPQTVRFGNDGSFDCVWIGETSYVWSHPVVGVVDFMGGYVRSDVQTTSNNWDITFVTSFNTVADSVTPSVRFSNVSAASVTTTTVNSTSGYISSPNPWGTADSAYFPNGITTGGGTNWIYGGNTYIGNAPSNGAGHEFFSSGSSNSTGDVSAFSSMRTPIFYDRNDTGYYADFNSTSSSAIRVRGGTLHGPNTTWGAYLQVGSNGYISGSYASVVTTNGNLHLDPASGYSTYINNYVNGLIYLNGSTYFISANGANYNGTSANSSALGGYSSSTYVGQFGNPYYQVNTWLQMNGSHGLYWPSVYGAHFYPNNFNSYTQFRLDGNKNGYGGIVDSYSAVSGMMYDSAGNGGVYREGNGRWYWYYLLSSDCMGIGTSATSPTYSLYLNKGVFAQSRIDATIYYDTNNTAYYLNPDGGSYFAGSVEVANGYFLSNGVGGAMYMTSVSGSFGGYLRTSGHMVLDQMNAGYNVYVLDGNSVGVVKNAGSQSWSAFSDGTIKNVHSVMENNLSKLESIIPIYYSFNNFDDDKNRIGLIAQEVQEHFPELVEIEPKTQKLTLDYTGLIPVLLGAIKELKKEIDTLKIN